MLTPTFQVITRSFRTIWIRSGSLAKFVCCCSCCLKFFPCGIPSFYSFSFHVELYEVRLPGSAPHPFVLLLLLNFPFISVMM
ncbi:hypothetical protein RchiOBHm_Chr4g0399871 [Rosa chinensis]|uniref:Uncharacterized protein n=1 Tax=Rosa chinensis TaxID=74649 RepID=A0A2P6QSQ0_ROSCH|nr:hypothetical protein RchiOBHm_Chr4g0399871 [Rosa chinensis]